MNTTCMVCGKTWTPKKWENFFDFCGCCKKRWTEDFERQFRQKLLAFNPPRKTQGGV